MTKLPRIIPSFFRTQDFVRYQQQLFYDKLKLNQVNLNKHFIKQDLDEKKNQLNNDKIDSKINDK